MNDLLIKTLTRIYDTTGLLPVNAVPGKGDYIISEIVKTPFLLVIKINPLQVTSTKFTNPKLANDIKLVAELAKTEQVVIDVHKGFVAIQIPKPASERNRIIYTSNNVPRGNGLDVILGLDIYNMPVHFNMGRELNTNLSFLGVPGSGKSVSMSRTIVSLARNNEPDRVKFLMVEVAKDGIDLRKFEHLPHLIHPVITQPNEAESALNYVLAQAKNGKFPFKLVVCVDEIAELIKQSKDTVTSLSSLVALGRAQNVVNLFATQITTKDTLGDDGKSIFSQIHNTVLGKAPNKQLSYILGKDGQLNAEALTGEGDLLLKSNDFTGRFAGVFVTVDDMQGLPRVETINHLPLNHYSNTNAVIEDTRNLVRAGQFETKEVPAAIVAEGLISLQRQIDESEYRDYMRGKQYFVLPISRVKELGRNPTIFKDRDQPFIVSIYKELLKRGMRLCS